MRNDTWDGLSSLSGQRTEETSAADRLPGRTVCSDRSGRHPHLLPASASAEPSDPRLPHTLDWLLEPENPSARYLTLTRVLGRPDDAPDVLAVRADIPHADPARAILAAQYPQGYWMRPGIGYSPRFRATVWQILFLAQLGMGRTGATDRAVAHLFAENQREDGAFRASKTVHGTPVCLNGNLLWALERLGYGDAPEVARAWAWLAREVEQRGFACLYEGGEPCTWEAVKVLWAADAVGAERRTSAVEAPGRLAAEWLLAHPPAPERDSPLWFRLTFPLAHAPDLLQWLETLVDAGYGADPRLAFAWEWLERKRLPDGAWPLEHTPGKSWASFGPKGEPNKWITIRALSVVKRSASHSRPAPCPSQRPGAARQTGDACAAGSPF